MGVDMTFLDADNSSNILNFININNSTISNLTIKNGRNESGGGIYMNNSDPDLINIKVAECSSCSPTYPFQENVDYTWCGNGGGIYMEDSSPYLDGVIVSDNNAVEAEFMDSDGYCTGFGGGIAMEQNSSPHIINSVITVPFLIKALDVKISSSRAVIALISIVSLL